MTTYSLSIRTLSSLRSWLSRLPLFSRWATSSLLTIGTIFTLRKEGGREGGREGGERERERERERREERERERREEREREREREKREMER